MLDGETAGLVAAHGAAGLGARVVLIERHQQTGGDCLWTGCVPHSVVTAHHDYAELDRAVTAGPIPPTPRALLAPRTTTCASCG